MPALPRKALVTAPPQGGKTSCLVRVYLESLRTDPLGSRAFIVPNRSYRDYLRILVMQQGGLDALPEAEILTLAEFLHQLSRQARLLEGRRMTSLEELLAFRQVLRQLNGGKQAGSPQALPAAQHLKKTVEALRNAGLFLKLLASAAELETAGRRRGAVEAAALHLREMQTSRRYDGLLAQELAVLALQSGHGARLLPELILIDGFYDLHPLHEAAVEALARHAPTFYITAPQLPGSTQAERFIHWLRGLGLEELPLAAGDGGPARLLQAISRVKAAGTCPEWRADTGLKAGSLELRVLPTYLCEAQFVADTILALHRAERIPLDEFLVILRAADKSFTAALEHRFQTAGLPLLDLTEMPRPGRVARFLAAAFSYAANPAAEPLHQLARAACPAILKPSHRFFALLHRLGLFLDAEQMRHFARESGADSFVKLLERLAEASRMRAPDVEQMRNLLAGIGREFIAGLQLHLGNTASGSAELAREEQALESIMEASASLVREQIDASELAPLLAEICLYAGGSRRELHTGGVYLVDALVARQWQKQVCFVAQADRDHWPQRREDLGSEEEALRASPALARIRLRSPEEHFAFEESLFLSAITRSTKLTLVTYARRKMDGNDIAPSPFLSILAPAISELGGSPPTSSTEAFANHRALLRHCARVLRYGGDGVSREVAAVVLDAAGENERARLFGRGGLNSEPAGEPLAVPETLIPSSFSPSALTAYRKCSYLYFSEHLVQPGDAPQSMQEGITPVMLGNAAHLALQEALAAFPGKADVCALFRRELTLCATHCAPADFPLELERHLAVWSEPLRKAYESTYERLTASGAEVLRLEEELRMGFADAKGRQCTLHGFLDRADRLPNGNLEVTDYKTSTWDSFSGKSGEGRMARYGVAVAPHVYSLLAQTAWGAAKAQFSYHLLEGNARAVLKPGDANLSAQKLAEAVLKSVAQSIAAIRACRFPRAPHTECADCASCEAYRLCRRDVFSELVPNEVETEFPEPIFKLEKEKLG